MNYRHIYHAGNICDVVKHAVLTLLLQRLREKPSPFVVLDSHAGVGLYNLADERAQKTGEAASGIIKLLHASPIPALQSYYCAINDLRKVQHLPQAYPGSPLLTASMMRPGDRLIACELQPEDYVALKRVMGHHEQAQLHQRDGYEALRALLPPPEKRGLVFIDPPFEQPDEFANLAIAVQTVTQRWPQGQIAIWYPIKERPAIWRFHEALAAQDLPKLMVAEFVYQEEIRADRLNGCGFILVNAPWQFDSTLADLFPQLHTALDTPHRHTHIAMLAG